MNSKTFFTPKVARFKQFLTKEEYKSTTIEDYSKIIQNFLEWKSAYDECVYAATVHKWHGMFQEAAELHAERFLID